MQGESIIRITVTYMNHVSGRRRTSQADVIYQIKTAEKKKLNFSRSALFPIKTRVFLKYFANGCSFSSSYIGKTCLLFKTRIVDYVKKDNKLHIFKHLHFTATSFDSYNSLSFKITDKANSKFDLKIKEALHINWRKPNLNAQQNHLALTLSLQLLSLLFFSVFVVFFCVSLSSIIFIIFDTNYQDLLLS